MIDTDHLKGADQGVVPEVVLEIEDEGNMVVQGVDPENEDIIDIAVAIMIEDQVAIVVEVEIDIIDEEAEAEIELKREEKEMRMIKVF